MKIKWQWFLGGKNMFWLSILLFIMLTVGFVATYVIDPVGNIVIKRVTDLNTFKIKEISEKYISELGLDIDKPIVYRFVEFRPSGNKDEILLGTFHKWNEVYYIDIRSELLHQEARLIETVRHETRHMIVTILKEKKIIDLAKYTEEIALEQNSYYNNLFTSGVYLLKIQQKGE